MEFRILGPFEAVLQEDERNSGIRVAEATLCVRCPSGALDVLEFGGGPGCLLLNHDLRRPSGGPARHGPACPAEQPGRTSERAQPSWPGRPIMLLIDGVHINGGILGRTRAINEAVALSEELVRASTEPEDRSRGTAV